MAKKKSTKHPSKQSAQTLSDFLSSIDAPVSIGKTAYPEVPAECPPLSSVPTGFVALIAAILKPHSGNSADAVVDAFELLHLVEGGKSTLTSKECAPTYDKGVREWHAHRHKELGRCKMINKQLSRVAEAIDTSKNVVDLDRGLGTLFPKDQKTKRRAFFKQWVESLFNPSDQDHDAILTEIMRGEGRHAGTLSFLLNRAAYELPVYHSKHISKTRREAGKKGAAAKNAKAAERAELVGGKSKRGRVKRKERDGRLAANRGQKKRPSASNAEELYNYTGP